MESITQGEARVFTYLNEEMASARDEAGHRCAEFVLPGTDELSARIKVYKSGGENTMHSHPREDHIFFILDGEATFHIESDENSVKVKKFDAVSLPRGTKYWFTSTGEDNLVMLRAGSGRHASERENAHGIEMLAGNHNNWRYVEGSPI